MNRPIQLLVAALLVPIAVLWWISSLGHASRPPSRDTIVRILASDSAHPEFGELFWDSQQRQETDLWAYASAFCHSADKPNCGPVRNLAAINQRTRRQPTRKEDPS